ncbi:MAG: hypothetical protein NXH90_01860, partial [Flavobacteriaceae bacterium]|nr:hypothetical protein [Flavobacteriaceae bacterium]
MSKLQSYFDYYEKHYNPKSSPWYKSSNETFAIMRAIQERLPSIDVFNETEDKKDLLEKSFQKSNQNEIDSIQTFLQRFVFDQKNGVGNVSQGVVWASEPNPHKEQILNNATPELIYQVLSSRSKEEVLLKTNELLRSGRGYHAVQNRLMRILFPNEFAAADATNKFDRLVNILNNKLGVEINGSSLLEKHTDLCRRIDTEDAVLRQMFTWDLFYMLENEFTLKKAVCYYGAPGTGKTYRTSKEAEKLIDAQRILIGKDIESEYSIKTVQFHPSYSYEDFMEGIRPTQEGGLQLYNGSFKQFCKENGKKEINLYTQTDFLNNPNFKDVNYDLSRIKISQLDIKEKEALALKD